MSLRTATHKRLLAYPLYGVAATCVLVASCSGGNGSSSPGGTGGTHFVPDATVGNEDCASDPLRTKLVVEQTGISADAYDCEILKYATQFNEPDPMIFKAIIYVESRFDYTAVGCPNTCGTPAGWTPDECGCCGLMQSIAPACSWDKDVVNFLPNGHPNVEKDPSAPNWPGSVFNPDVNIKAGIQVVADNRVRLGQQFPNCTEAQYTMMAIGEFNSYGSAKSCTTYNSDYTSAVLEAYHRYASAAGYAEHSYP